MDLPKLEYFWQYLEYWAKKDPEFPTIKFKGKTTTAGELLELVNQTAKAFLYLGVKKGDRIITILPTSLEFILTFCASTMIGAITTPMDVRYRPADYQRFLSHVDPKIIVMRENFDEFDIASTVLDVSKSACPNAILISVEGKKIDQSLQSLLEKPLDLDAELDKAKKALTHDDGALIVFTGGTSGLPKAALLSQGNIVYSIYYETEAFLKNFEVVGIPQRTTVLSNLPTSHVGGVEEIIGCPLCGGMQLVVQESWSPYPVLESIQKEKIAFSGGVPTMLAILLSLPDLDKYDLSSVKLVLLSGEKLNLELLQGVTEKFTKNIINGYGSTEAGTETTFSALGDSLEKLANGYAGNPLPEQKIKIVDDDGKEVPAGEEGEILVKGPMTIKSYFKMPNEDKAGFTKDGWCKMGDLGYLDETGGLWVKGRKKFIIRVGSFTVLPTEVEEVVLDHPDVAMAAAIGIPDKIYGEVIWLFVIPESGKKPSEEEILKLCKQKLADFKVPRKIVFRDSLPLTRLEKTDRVTLRKEVLKEIEKK